MKISYLRHENIDKKKWDNCIAHANNSLIYAYSYYLDAMSENWNALVMNDYEAVMPLTWAKKFGFRYLRQPVFTQQLGIFGNISFEKNITELFKIHKNNILTKIIIIIIIYIIIIYIYLYYKNMNQPTNSI